MGLTILEKKPKKQIDLLKWQAFFTKDIPEMKTKSILPVSLYMLLSASNQAAEQSTPVIIDASPCLALTRPIERLTCFEDQAKSAQQPGALIPQQNLPMVSIPRKTARQPQQARPEPEPEAPQTVVIPENSFEENYGIRKNSNDRNNRDTELIARIAVIKELNPNRKLITLENGQVWEQQGTKVFAMKAGDEVRIYPSRWGNSYRLASQSHNGFITVQRLQ